jgi:hypothetical protein
MRRHVHPVTIPVSLVLMDPLTVVCHVWRVHRAASPQLISAPALAASMMMG